MYMHKLNVCEHAYICDIIYIYILQHETACILQHETAACILQHESSPWLQEVQDFVFFFTLEDGRSPHNGRSWLRSALLEMTYGSAD